LNERAPGVSISGIKYVDYPYLYAKLLVSFQAKTMGKEINEEVICMVDMVNGKEALTEKVIELQKLNVDEKYSIPVKFSYEEAKEKAVSYISHFAAERLKIMSIPKVSFIEGILAYKLFWFISCNWRQSEFNLIMDSVNGQFHSCYI